MAVVLYHLWLLQVNPPDWSRPLGIGWLGVQLFFVLSGLVLYLPYADGRRRLALDRYTAARVLRIVPAFWVVLLVVPFALNTTDRTSSAVVLAVVFLLWGLFSRRKLPWLGFVLTAAAAARWIDTGGASSLRHLKDYAFLQYNDVTALVPQGWTLSLEAGFYLLLPAIVYATAGRRWLQLPVIGALIGIGLYWRLFSSLPLTPLSFVDQFGFGMAAAIAVAHGLARRSWVALVGVAIVVGSMFTGPVARDWLPTSTIFALGCAFILAWLASYNPRVSFQPLVWLGTISYGIYVWHYLVITWLDQKHGFRGHSILIRAAIVIPLTLLLAALSWLLVESPFLRQRGRLASAFAASGRQVRRIWRTDIPAPGSAPEAG